MIRETVIFMAGNDHNIAQLVYELVVAISVSVW